MRILSPIDRSFIVFDSFLPDQDSKLSGLVVDILSLDLGSASGPCFLSVERG